MKAIPDIKLNDRVRIIPHPKYGRPRAGEGKVIAIVGNGVELTLDEVFELYGDVTKTITRSGKPLKPEMFTRPCVSDRIVVQRDDPKPGSDGFCIIPNRPFQNSFFCLSVIPEVKWHNSLD